MKNAHFILTLSCPDVKGIVASVSSFLTEHQGFILESAQFGDFATGQFFMRTEFEAPLTAESFAKKFAAVAKKFAMNWQIRDLAVKPKLVILVSKAEHCLNDLLYRYRTGQLAVDIPAVISNHETLRPIVEWHKIPFHYLPITPQTKAAQEKKLLALMGDADIVALARYMQVLSPAMCEKLLGRAINIHHSFLPSFKGAKPYHQAYDRGVKIIGATAHYVTSDLDEGPIIEQEVVRVEHSHKPEHLVALGQDIESQVLSRALKYQVEHRILLNGHKTVIFK